jgi:hypothetical protein
MGRESRSSSGPLAPWAGEAARGERRSRGQSGRTAFEVAVHGSLRAPAGQAGECRTLGQGTR